GYAVRIITIRLIPTPRNTLSNEIKRALKNFPPLSAYSYALKVKSTGTNPTAPAETAALSLKEIARRLINGRIHVSDTIVKIKMFTTLKILLPFVLYCISSLLENLISRTFVSKNVGCQNKHCGNR